MTSIAIHYSEIALKKGNRRFFVNKLSENIKTALKSAEVVGNAGKIHVEKLPGRLLLSNYGDRNSIVEERLRKIPGIANFMLARVSLRGENGEDILDDLKKGLAEELKDKKFKSFRVTTRRADKNFPLTSEEINKEIGAFVAQKTKARVNLENPEFIIYVEVLSKRILFGFKKIEGVRGLPVGSSGKVVSLLSGGIDSPVAAFMMMKRGCRVAFVHFHGHPFLDTSSREKVRELVKILDQYQNGSKLYSMPFGEIQKRVVLSMSEQFRVIVYRRLMMKIAGEIAKKEKAGALVTGESLGQVASQTLENILTIQDAAPNMVLRPLIGMDKEEIIAIAKKIGTYEISIRDDQDCCQLFTPKHPATVSDVEVIKKMERRLNIEKFVKDAIDRAEIL